MTRGLSRRTVLAAASVTVLPWYGRVRGQSAGDGSGSRTESRAFDPAKHGFGFRNWSTAIPVYPEHAHDEVDETQIRRGMRRRWRAPFERTLRTSIDDIADAVLDVVARQLYVSINQRSATNGHCYGMVFAAQRYFERPGDIPLGWDTASELGHPAEPLDAPREPVGEEIDFFQNRQFLDFHAWLGRRLLLRPSWIDYAAQLRNLTEVLDEYGTAGITLTNPRTRLSHQVLVTDLVTDGPTTTLTVYDPNWAAREYDGARPGRTRTVRVTPSASRPIEPYSSEGYDTFVFNRYDRIIAARGDVDSLGDLDADVTGTDVDGLLDAVLFLVDSPNVAVSVTDPDGVPLRRDTSTFMDRRHSRYHAMRYRYGASPGRYLVSVIGLHEGTYRLEAMGANAAGRTLDGIQEAPIGAGEVHEYAARLRPNAAVGTLTRVNRGGSLLWPAVGVGAGAVGLAGAAYAGLRCRESTGGAGPSDPA